MDDLIETLRAGLPDTATDEQRALAADACRKLRVILERRGPIEASAPPAPVTSTSAPAPLDPSQIVSVVGALRGLPPDQLLDLAIARLRAAIPAGADVPTARPLQLHLVPIPPRKP